MGTRKEWDGPEHEVYIVKGEVMGTMDYESMIGEKLDRIEELHEEVEVLIDEIDDLAAESELFESAVAMRRDMDVFIKAGFKEDQAFDLIKMMFLRSLEEDEC